jgi:hypothetical protein
MLPEDIQKFLPVFGKIRPMLIRKEFISKYSHGLRHAFNLWSRGALMCRFMKDCPSNTVGVDIASAYPSQLRSMAYIPIYGELDEFREYQGERLETYTLYIVENAGDAAHPHIETQFILNRRWNLVSGHVLKNSGVHNRSTVRIWGYIRPVHLAINRFGSLVSLVKGQKLPYNVSKQLLNSLIGLTGKRSATKELSVVTSNYDEALAFAKNDPHSVLTKWRQNYPPLYLAVAQSETVSLVDGLYAGIQFHVYDRMRLALLRMYQALIAHGATVYGVHVDCMIVDTIPDDFPVSPKGTLKSMGKYRKDGAKEAPPCVAMVIQNEAPVLLTQQEALTGEWRNTPRVHIFPVPSYTTL